jgi:hypothetical protein
MDSPPASLESQRSQRDFSVNFLLSPTKKTAGCEQGQKVKNKYSLRTLRLCLPNEFFVALISSGR